LQSLKEATTDPMSDASCSVAVVGVGTSFRILPHEELSAVLTRLEQAVRWLSYWLKQLFWTVIGQDSLNFLDNFAAKFYEY